MNQTPRRSNLLMNAGNSALLVIDVQEKLLPLIPNHRRIVWNIARLLDAAKLLGVRSLATEQYPKGLGATVAELRERLPEPPEKSMFSCRECSALFAPLRDEGIDNVLLVGIEAHVCVQQTALDLLAQGFNVFLAVDAIGSRFELDYSIAIERMKASGATATTTESVLFEWCESSANPQFKLISQMVRQQPPA
ncbi:MAG: hydrolase [Planctomycetota bacterium]